MLRIVIFALLALAINCQDNYAYNDPSNGPYQTWNYSYSYNNSYNYNNNNNNQASVVVTSSSSLCTNNTCYNGGTCQDLGLSFVCRCPYGYTGSRCEMFVDACTGVQCTGATCQSENSNEFACRYSYYYTAYDVQTTAYTFQPSSCDAYNLCQNGGKCNLGYTNNNTLVFGCSCPSGFTGLTCQEQYAYGVQPESSNYYSYGTNEHLYRSGQTFLLMNTEITQKSNITQIKFYAQTAGTFVFTFVKFQGCGGAGQPKCAELANNQFEQNAQNSSTAKITSSFKAQLEQARASSSFSITIVYPGYNAIDLPGGFQAEAGTLVALTQVDGMIGYPHAFTTNQYADFYIDIDALEDMTMGRLDFNTTPSSDMYTIMAQSAATGTETTQNQTMAATQINWALPVMVADNNRIIKSSPTDPSNQCSNAVCLNGGTCNWVAAQSTYTCSCPTGVTGQHCEHA